MKKQRKANIGYFYWGFLGDKKYNSEKKLVSTPDGNAFYSWSIIRELQKRDYKVHILYDRDVYGFMQERNGLFDSFATDERLKAYMESVCHTPMPGKLDDLIISFEDYYKNLFNDVKFDFVLLEWRWNIPGRNDLETKENKPELYQPDREIMEEIIYNCNKNNIPLIVFDLDYKLREEDIKKYNIKKVIELGNFWSTNKNVLSKKVQIPFDFSCIDEKQILMDGFDSDVIYIGNRYERDWAIDKYLPKGSVVHGNWLEPGHGDPEHEWPDLNFRKRLAAFEICRPYQHSIATVLLAKKLYCDNGFMTARIQEAVFYGTVPFFIEEYGNGVISEYAGKYAQFLTVSSKLEVSTKIATLKDNPYLRKEIIEYLRHHLRFMDSKFFVDDILSIV